MYIDIEFKYCNNLAYEKFECVLFDIYKLPISKENVVDILLYNNIKFQCVDTNISIDESTMKNDVFHIDKKKLVINKIAGIHVEDWIAVCYIIFLGFLSYILISVR